MSVKRELPINFTAALKQLIELDHDAMEAYEAALHRLENKEYKRTSEEFKRDHEGHINEIAKFLRLYNAIPPTKFRLKSFLSPGKASLLTLSGDKAILYAMRSNELDMNEAYTRIIRYDDKKIPQPLQRTLQQGLQDEKCHLNWIENKLLNEINYNKG
jgi:bacterioferritin (cytochrome b1)